MRSGSRKSEDQTEEKSPLLGHADRVGREESGQGVSNGGLEMKENKKEKSVKGAEPHLVPLAVP